MKCSKIRLIGILLFALIASLMVRPAFSETCICDSPCSGSRACPDGCWAFCEERASGPYCAKGCVYDMTTLASKDTLSERGKLNTVDIKLPKEQVKPLLEQLFGITLVSIPAVPKTDTVVVKLKNSDLKGILDELKKQGIALQVKK
jgi:hypothetical protein